VAALLDEPGRLGAVQAFAATLAGGRARQPHAAQRDRQRAGQGDFVGPHVAIGPAISALAVEKFLYSSHGAVVVALGMVALLFAFSLPSLRSAVVALRGQIGTLGGRVS